MARIIVSGVIANKYLNGGAVWTRLNWILGFQRLGFDVLFVEQIAPQACVDDAGNVTPFERSVNFRYFRKITEQFGLAASAALIYGGGEQVWGRSYAELIDAAGSADLLVNITGHLSLEAIKSRIRCRAYLDLDPGFTQIWRAEGGDAGRLAGHDYYFTVGENIGTAACPLPTGGIHWLPVRQPVVLDQWPMTLSPQLDRFTTIASWRGPYAPVTFNGRTYGVKVHEFRKFLPLPAQARAALDGGPAFEIALDIHPGDAKDLAALGENGWAIVDPKSVAGDPDSFRQYVQHSGAEFSAAQGIYVDTNSGWFSDRTARYLASGKPALVQETGFSQNLPAGEGLVPFRTLDEAVEGAKRIAKNYSAHCRAARGLAEVFFDSDKVLGRFLEQVGMG